MTPISIQVLRAIVEEAKTDATLSADLKTQRTSLIADLTQNPEAAKEITSGSGNGLSHTATLGFTKAQRLEFLNTAIYYIDNNLWPSSTSYARF